MALPDFMDLIRHDPRRSLVIRAVAGSPGGVMPDVETLWRKTVFTAHSAGRPLSGKFSLEDLINTNKAITLVDDGSGGQPVDVIFTSLVILTTEALAGGAAFTRFLTDRIRQRFGNVMPDGDRIDIRLAHNTAAEYPVTVYLGYGVHVPAAEDSDQQGRIEVLAADGEAVGEPLIVDVHAGLYPGQKVLAFSRSQDLTAAVHPDLPAGVMFCLGHLDGGSAAKGSASALPPLIALSCSGEPDAASIEIQPLSLEPGSTSDIRYDITGVRAQLGRVRLCQIDVTLDSRASRLRPQPALGSLSLAVVGFAVRESFNGNRMARYWIDRTAGGIFRHSAMLAERDSVVVQGREPRIYRRADLRYDRRSGQNFTVERVSFEGEWRSMIISSEEPFGYLTVPTTMKSVVGGAGSGGENGYSINWVGGGLTIQFASGETMRASHLYDQSPFGMIGQNGHELRVQTGADIWALVNTKPVPAGNRDFGAGTRLVIGPLVVDVMEAHR